ncbi:hypothetical protein DFH06DRAFT_601225 [Mycena polygramma]|nr:hypothetical protein DFH06DRAFT_601225 [Mycena polygramma]
MLQRTHGEEDVDACRWEREPGRRRTGGRSAHRCGTRRACPAPYTAAAAEDGLRTWVDPEAETRCGVGRRWRTAPCSMRRDCAAGTGVNDNSVVGARRSTMSTFALRLKRGGVEVHRGRASAGYTGRRIGGLLEQRDVALGGEAGRGGRVFTAGCSTCACPTASPPPLTLDERPRRRRGCGVSMWGCRRVSRPRTWTWRERTSLPFPTSTFQHCSLDLVFKRLCLHD